MPSKSTERSRGGRTSVKKTFNLPTETAELLHASATDLNTTMAEVIRRAVRLEQFLRDTTKDGGKILVEDADKSVKEIILF